MIVSRLQFVSALAVLATASAGLQAARAAEPAAPAYLPAHFLSVLPPMHGGSFALQAASNQASSDDPLPPGKGRDLTEQTCTQCHGVTMFSSQRHTRDQWSDLIDTMVGNGLSASDQDLDTILNYLSTNLAPPKQGSDNAPATPPAAQPQQPQQAPPQ